MKKQEETNRWGERSRILDIDIQKPWELFNESEDDFNCTVYFEHIDANVWCYAQHIIEEHPEISKEIYLEDVERMAKEEWELDDYPLEYSIMIANEAWDYETKNK